MIADSEVAGSDNLLTPLESLLSHSESLADSSVTALTLAQTPVIHCTAATATATVVLPVALIALSIQPSKLGEGICQSSSTAGETELVQEQVLETKTPADAGLIVFADIPGGPCGDASPSSGLPKKVWKKRPASWILIAEEAELNGNHASLQKFKADFEGMSDFAAYRKLYKWKKDVKNHKPPSYSTRIPSYGKVIDDNLLKDFQGARSKGILVGDELLRQYLMVHLAEANLNTLLIENGGKHTFGASWASRFCKRHNVGSRRKLKNAATMSEEDNTRTEKLNACLDRQKNRVESDASEKKCSAGDLTSSDTGSDSNVHNSKKKLKRNFL